METKFEEGEYVCEKDGYTELRLRTDRFHKLVNPPKPPKHKKSRPWDYPGEPFVVLDLRTGKKYDIFSGEEK